MESREIYQRLRRATAGRRAALTAIAFAAVLVTAACGGGGGLTYGSSSAPATPISPVKLAASGAGSPSGGAGGALPATNGIQVTISNFAFTPAMLTVPAGTTVTWTNQDVTAHTVTSTTKAFDSGVLNPKATFSFTFTTPGTYAYYCSIHPFMTATVTVQ